MATNNWGFENGGIVPITDGQYLSQTPAGRQAITEHGTPELIAALGALREWSFLQIRRHCARALPCDWARLLTSSPGQHLDRRYTHHRVDWVLEGPMFQKAGLIAEAKRICLENSGRTVIIMIRHPTPPRPAGKRSADPWSSGLDPKVEICYKIMMIVPRPVKIKLKNARRWLNWKPVVIEPSRSKLYHTPAIEIYRSPNSKNPDDYRIDQIREIQMLSRASGDLAQALTKEITKWKKVFGGEKIG